ncbi:SUKH-3 domain-containing protein [Streptomyces sp. 2231.1]|uniref:SUKH-3 domain-containing protein n=1 Tax=Streptomyces sp. 2231.1 TaxID=1855347 RepID=UPI0015A300F8
MAALRPAGWFPGRCVDVSSDVQSLEGQGYVPSPVTTDFLASFRGLKIGPAREDGPSSTVNRSSSTQWGSAGGIRTKRR